MLPAAPPTQPSLPALVQPGPAPSEAEPFPIYWLQLDRDLILIGLGLAVWTVNIARSRDTVADPCSAPDSCNPSQVNSFDRFATDQHSSSAERASDVTRALTIASTGTLELYMLLGRWDQKGRGVFADLIVDGEVVLLTTALTSLLERSTGRLRPLIYREPPLAPGSQRNSDDVASFPSGHTSTAFAAASAGCTTFVRRMRPGWGKALVACAPGFALSALTGVLRVAAGRHFPTDVLAGAALGITIGVAVPLLHPDPRPAERRVLASLAPVEGGFVLRLGGEF